MNPALSYLPQFAWDPRTDVYANHASTKLDTLRTLLQHHLATPGAPPLKVAVVGPDNQLIPDERYLPGGEYHIVQSIALGHDRVVVFLQFPKNNWVVIAVCYSNRKISLVAQH